MPNSNLPALVSYPLWIHIAAGGTALALFSIPLLTKKGGRTHVKTGWVYAGAMFAVALTTFWITPWRFFVDPAGTEKSRSFAAFLCFIALFALTSLQQGLLVLKRKRRPSAELNSRTLGLPILLLLASLAIAVAGLFSRNWLFAVFGGLAAQTAYGNIQYWRTPSPHQYDWWFFHLECLFTCCIGTVTAFVVTAVPRLWPGLDTLAVWLLPTALMTPWMIWFRKKYEKKFGVTQVKKRALA